MTLGEAWKIARIVSKADHGCTSCIDALVADLNKAGLGFVFALEPGKTWNEPDETGFMEDGNNWPLVSCIPVTL